MFPEVGFNNPSNKFSNVVFPDPDFPITPTKVFFVNFKLNSNYFF